MLTLIRGTAPASPRRPASPSPRTGDAVSDWTLRQFASEGALGATAAAANTSLRLVRVDGAK